MRIRSGLLLLLAIEPLLAGCAILDKTPPDTLPSKTATGYVGKPLSDLEQHWSVPWNIGTAGDPQAATWLFNQFNLAGCTVTVHTDANGIIKTIEWTRGCGPKGTGTPPPAEGFGP